MKKMLLSLIFFLICSKNVVAISASSAIGMDLDNGRVLYGYKINDKRLIASITKIMTAIIAIENSDINQKVLVTDIINETYGSSIYLKEGEQITIKDLLYGLMLRSGNDAALVIAKEVSGSKEEFVYLMNEYASNLKMENTVFYNPHGLEEDDGSANISTALDMAKLTKYAMQNDIFREIFMTKTYIAKTNLNTYVWKNKNKLLKEDYITGGKTGYTELAKRTLVTTGSKNNINVVVVTLNDPNDWADHKSIYNQIFKKYTNRVIISKNEYNVINNGYYKNNDLYINNNINMTLTNQELKQVVINNKLFKNRNYYDNSLIGYAEVSLKNIVYHKEPIYIKVQKDNNSSYLNKRIKDWLKKW